VEQDIKDATVQIMKLLYDWDGEVVVSISEDVTFLFINGKPYETDEEAINALIRAEIIEQDGGCEEEGNERLVFTLTPEARGKIEEILKKKPSKASPKAYL
jgi:hypothetical protein